MLLPILDKFIETAQGSPDLTWWNRVCHHHLGGGGSGSVDSLSGWITVFNVFNDKGKWLGDNNCEEWIKINEFDIVSGYATCKLNIKGFRSGVVKSTMYMGHISTKIIDNNKLIPQLSWCIIDEPKK